MSKSKFSTKLLTDQAAGYLRKLRHYSPLIFVAFVVLLYGFILLRVNSLSNQQPSAQAVSGQVKAAQIPHIDTSVVKQLQSLQDNSVSVQTLFNQARDNPFQE